MAKTIEVTAAQVNAARLLVKQATARGESVPLAVAALANAKPVTAGSPNGGTVPVADNPSTPSTNGHATTAANAAASRSSAQPPRPRYAG